MAGAELRLLANERDTGRAGAALDFVGAMTGNNDAPGCPEVGNSRKKEVEDLGIHVGCVITYEDEFMILNNRYYLGRALDNRIGDGERDAGGGVAVRRGC